MVLRNWLGVGGEEKSGHALPPPPQCLWERERSPAPAGACKTRLFKELCKAGARGWRKGPLYSTEGREGGGWGSRLGRGLEEWGGGGPEEVGKETPKKK